MQLQRRNVYCHVAETKSAYKSVFTAQQSRSKVQSVLTVDPPLKRETIEKYYKKESDLSIIKSSLLEEPSIFQFDDVTSGSR